MWLCGGFISLSIEETESSMSGSPMTVVPKLVLLVAPWLMVNPSRGPPALKQVTSSRIEKIIKNLVLSTMNVQANLSIIICYILMGQNFKKFKKSKFQYQSLTNIFFQYAPMAPRQWPPGGPWPPVWEPLSYENISMLQS